MTTASSALFLALLTPAFVEDKPEELILGKWQGKVKEGDKEFMMTIEFVKDGTFKSMVKVPDAKDPIVIKGKWKLIDGKTLETEATFMGETKKDKDTIKVTKDKLSV